MKPFLPRFKNFKVSDPVMYQHTRGCEVGIVKDIGKRKALIKTMGGEEIWLNKNHVWLIEDVSLKHMVLRMVK